jgi:hypothetical protein
MNGLYIPEFNMLRFNINYNKIEIYIGISIKKL